MKKLRVNLVQNDAGTDVATDASSNVYAAGIFRREADFGGGTLTSPGLADGYTVKYGP